MADENNNYWWLYVLKLEEGKWFVGVSYDTPEQSFTDHKKGHVTNWTRTYKPLKVQYAKDLGMVDLEKAQLAEGKATRIYMEKYGEENVRGGDLTHLSQVKPHKKHSTGKNSRRTIIIISILILVILYLLADKFWLAPAVNTVIVK